MPDPFIGLPILLGTAATAVIVKRMNAYNNLQAQARERERKRIAKQAAKRQAKIHYQRLAAEVVMAQATQNRVLGTQIAAEALSNPQLPDVNRLPLLRALAAEVDRENALLTAFVRDGSRRPIPRSADEGTLEFRLNEIVRRYTR